jgi:hypothetical protein
VNVARNLHRIVALLENLIGMGEGWRRYLETERFGRFEIDGAIVLGGLLGKSAGLSLLRMRSTYEAALRYRSRICDAQHIRPPLAANARGFWRSDNNCCVYL